MIYILALFLILLGVFYLDNKPITSQKNRYLYFVWLLLTLIVGLRYKVGGDTIGYFEQYKYWPTIENFSLTNRLDSRYAIGYQLLWSICKSVNVNFWLYQLVHAIIVNTSFFYLFRKTDRTFLAIFLFFLYPYFYYNMEILRAAISVCIFIFSLNYYFKKKWIVYYSLVLLAVFFHTQSVVLVLFPFLLYLNKIKTNILGLLGIVAISFIILALFNFVPIVNDLVLYLGIMQDGLAEFYNNTKIFNSNAIILVTLQIIPSLIILYVHRNSTDYKYKGFLILYIVFAILALKFPVLFGRLNDFIIPILLFCMADLFSKKQTMNIRKKKFLRIIMIVLFVCTTAFNYIKNSYYPEYKKYYPYSSILNPKENSERDFFVRDMIINR